MKDNLKDKVLKGLEMCPEARDSDIKLTNWIWLHYYPDLIDQDIDGEYTVRLINLYKLPSEDNIKRIRAFYQNVSHIYLPTSEEVRKQRRIGEQEWRIYLGNLTNL